MTGYGFGDNCYDTGQPPPGEGTLGRPLTGIEVYLEQGVGRHLVAVGDADPDYAWEVQIVIPGILDVGEVDVVVVGNRFEAFEESGTPVWVKDDRDDSAEIDLATFGPERLDSPVSTPASAFQGTDWTPVLLLAGSLVTFGGVIAMLRRRSTN